MGAINRFADLSVSKFDPLSLDEIMAVPLYKQKQHDKLLADNEALYKSLVIDPLDVHKEEALKIKKDFESKLDAQSLQLAKSGIDQNSQAEFLKSKREYDQLVSPTGRVGQINNAKKVYAENFKEYIEDATKNKSWSREKALENWNNKFANQYTGYNENKDITNIGNYGAPKKIEVNDKLKFVKDILGEQVVSEAKASGYSLIPQADGSMVFADSKGRRIETSNKPNLQNALNLLNQQMTDPEWKSSIDFEGVDPKSVNQQLTSGVNAMLSNKVVDNRTTDYTYHTPAKGSGDEDGKTPLDIITNTEVFNPSAYAGNSFKNNQQTYSTLLNKVKTGKQLTPEENIKLNQLKDFQTEVNKTLASNSEYKKLLNERNTIAKTLGITFNLDDVSVSTQVQGDGNTTREVYYKGNTPMTSVEQTKYFKYLQKANNVESKIEKIQNKTTEENNVKYNGYQLIPTTAGENTSLKLMNDSFENAMRANPENLLSFTNIESVDVDGKRKDNLTSNDKLGIQELFNGTERGSMQIVSFIPKGFSGKPEYVVEFNTKEGNTYNLDGMKYGNDDLGDGKPVRVKLSFNKSSGDVLKNINGYIQEYLSTKGKNGEGAQLAQSMAINARKSELSGNAWKNLVSPDMDLNQIDPIVLQKLGKELTKYGFHQGATEAEAKVAIRKLLKEKGNTAVYFD